MIVFRNKMFHVNPMVKLIKPGVQAAAKEEGSLVARKVTRNAGTKVRRIKRKAVEKAKEAQQAVLDAQPANVSRTVAYNVGRNPVNSSVKALGGVVSSPGAGTAIGAVGGTLVGVGPYAGGASTYVIGPALTLGADKGKAALAKVIPQPQWVRNWNGWWDASRSTGALAPNPNARSVRDFGRVIKSKWRNIRETAIPSFNPSLTPTVPYMG